MYVHCTLCSANIVAHSPNRMQKTLEPRSSWIVTADLLSLNFGLSPLVRKELCISLRTNFVAPTLHQSNLGREVNFLLAVTCSQNVSINTHLL